jgi:PAS domain S-box-containing protein
MTEQDEAVRREMANSLIAVVYSAVRAEGDLLPRLDFANRHAIEYFGVGPEAIADDRWIELVHPDDRAGVRAAWAGSMATGQHYRHEHRIKMADGSYRRFLAQALPLRDDDGAILKWYGVIAPIDAEPRRRGPTATRVDYYPLRDDAGMIHLLEVAIWQDRPEDTAAKLHPSGSWYRVELVAESVWHAPD